jgi:hypothetical protein
MMKKVLNALRFGLVPDEYLKEITIDYEYYNQCFQNIKNSRNISHFAMGPYGSGKSHFIRCVNHIAKEDDFATACIEIDPSGQISFAFPQRLFLEIFENTSLEEDEKELSFTEILSRFMDFKGNEVHDLFNISIFEDRDKKRFFDIYRTVLLLRKSKNFHNKIGLLDSVFLGDDEFTLDYASNELYQLFQEDGFSKNFFRMGIKPLVSHTEKCVNEFVMALMLLTKGVQFSGKKGLLVFVDELIFDCESKRKDKLRLVLQKLEDIKLEDKLPLKVIFGVAKGKTQTMRVGEVLEGFVYKDNLYELKNMNPEHKMILGRKIINLYEKAYPPLDTLSEEGRFQILESAEQNSLKTGESVRGFIKNTISLLDRLYDRFHQQDLRVFLQKEEMQGVVKAQWNSKYWIDVAPKIDKSHAILERIKYLLNHQITSNILVICASKDSVFQIKKGLVDAVKKGHLQQSAHIEPRTIDSLATFLFLKQFPKGTPLYDEFIHTDQIDKIHYFLQTLGMDPSILDHCFLKDSPKILLVDGVEQIGSERALVLIELLHKVDGFMVFGDRCRGMIQDFVKENKMDKEELYHAIIKQVGVQEKHLLTPMGEDFPGEEEDKAASIFYRLRAGILQKDLPVASEGVVQYLKEMMEELDSTSPWFEFFQKEGAHFITRNKIELFWLSRFLHQKKISHRINLGFQEEGFDQWIAYVFSSQNFPLGSAIHVVQFKKMYTTFKKEGAEGYAQAQEIWENILEMLAEEGNAKIFIKDILEAILLQSKINEKFYFQSEERVHVHTFNGMNGREENHVVFCTSKDKQSLENNMIKDLEECLGVYVSFAEAKNKPFSYQIPAIKKNPFFVASQERWIYIEKNSLGEPTLSSIEIRQEDVDEKSFSKDHYQTYIRQNILLGDSIELHKIDDEKIFYGIYHKNKNGEMVEIGTMRRESESGKNFVEELQQIRHVSLNNDSSVKNDLLPTRITNLYVEGLESSIGYNQEGEMDVWLILRLSGLGDCSDLSD